MLLVHRTHATRSNAGKANEGALEAIRAEGHEAHDAFGVGAERGASGEERPSTLSESRRQHARRREIEGLQTVGEEVV